MCVRYSVVADHLIFAVPATPPGPCPVFGDPPNVSGFIFRAVVPPPAETNISELDRVTVTEFVHYSSVLCGSQLRNKNRKCMPSSWDSWLGIEQLAPDVTCDFRSELPLHLVIETNDSGQKMRYTPRSDFHVSIRDFPHIILEVNSQANAGDEFSNWLRSGGYSEQDTKGRDEDK
ncbi:hypothetical protein BC827DRAFT_1159585 [Russula dissimulans]|nr:hypothetical protein BC827DRAFT_1159585 [Russula dissimulans]